jgi:ArsR family transcriptional regulator
MRELKAHFTGLANPTRLAIIAELSRGDAVGSDLARRLKVSQPLLSWHLRVMRRAGLITTRRAGRELYCALDRAGITAYQERFNQFIGRETADAVGSSVMTDINDEEGNAAFMRGPETKETANAI